jgi:hypothetical protein
VNRYLDGKRKIVNELDCVSIVESIRDLKLMMKIILNKHQRQLLGFSKSNVLLNANKKCEFKNTGLLEAIPNHKAPSYQKVYFNEKVDELMLLYESKHLNRKHRF